MRISANTGGFQYLKAGDTITIGAGGPNPERRTITTVVRPNPSGSAANVLFAEPLTAAHPAGDRVEGAALQTGVGFQPDYATEGKHEALEFAAGNYGLLESALEYARDDEDPRVRMTGPKHSSGPIETTFEWINEPSVIRYTMDGRKPTIELAAVGLHRPPRARADVPPDQHDHVPLDRHGHQGQHVHGHAEVQDREERRLNPRVVLALAVAATGVVRGRDRTGLRAG